ncbi:MAG TPA: transcription antitermination factor NusB [Acidimicrobiales bacterium]|nr:transcription antitermination factor NusB [Acidimicrobiales bacterium]
MARERALELLYEADAKSAPVDDVLAALPVAPDPYAVDIVTGVSEHRAEIDAVIKRLAPDWPVERMPAVDRAVLRVGVYELTQRPDVPTAVVLDEAVALAKRYSTEESGRFVNGVLAAAARELRPS